MGKSKKSKGKKGKGGGKKGGKKGSKKEKKEVVKEPPPPPDLNTFVYVRRKNTTLILETHPEDQVHEMKLRVATILKQNPDDVLLLSMLEGNSEVMDEFDIEPPKKDDGKKKDKKGSKGKKDKGSKKKGKKDKKGSKGKGKDDKGKGKDAKEEPQEPPGELIYKTIGNYGFNPTTATIFSPGVIGAVFKDKDGNFEKPDLTPYSEFPIIPEEIRLHLRNYVPAPPPPPKKKSAGGGKKGGPKK